MNNNLKSPCNACPFRKNSAGGYLGGRWTALQLHQFIMSESNFACHKTIEIDGVETNKNEHCVGSILYMNKNAKRCSHNSELKQLQEKFRGDDNSNILSVPEFIEHHKDAVVTEPIIQNEIEVECNDCDWKGKKEDLNFTEDDDNIEIDVCPNCCSDNIYEF